MMRALVDPRPSQLPPLHSISASHALHYAKPPLTAALAIADSFLGTGSTGRQLTNFKLGTTFGTSQVLGILVTSPSPPDGFQRENERLHALSYPSVCLLTLLGLQIDTVPPPPPSPPPPSPTTYTTDISIQIPRQRLAGWFQTSQTLPRTAMQPLVFLSTIGHPTRISPPSSRPRSSSVRSDHPSTSSSSAAASGTDSGGAELLDIRKV
ncbi:hypothetical protein B0T13DRAFT_14494 [Neurospora crassa]|nr:hypothetical protein B0T13DRAFT_14494 [Neurospora crassa]